MNFNAILKENAKVKNFEGAEAFELSPEMELYTALVTCALTDKFYETSKQRVDRIVALVGKCDHRYVAQLAVYARRKMNLRSVPLLLLVELARVHSGDDLVSRAVEKCICRADEIMELLMCYQWRNPVRPIMHTHAEVRLPMVKRLSDEETQEVAVWTEEQNDCKPVFPRKKLGKLSHQIQVGLQKAFNNFDEYQFAKYDRDNLEVKLRDALFLVHPKAKDAAQQALFDKIASGSLATPYTWETELSALGCQQFESVEARADAFRMKWEELIESDQLGYMALMRNLRNMLEAGVGENLMLDVCARLADETQVARARQFPFRYLSAYKELKEGKNAMTSKVMSALEAAASQSARFLDGFSDKTHVMVACDMSGSMQSPLSAHGKVQMYEVGLMLSMLLRSRCEKVITGIFGNEWKIVNLPLEGVLANTDALRNRIGEVGYGTVGELPLKWLLDNKVVVDKVMMFTDMQFWGGGYGGRIKELWDEYRELAPEAHLYLFDLSGYGQSPIDLPRKDVTCISGWSDRVFEMLTCLENGSDILAEIRKTEL